MEPSRKLDLSIPKGSRPSSATTSPVAPKTPADEAIDFFQSEKAPDEKPIRVYELSLDIDGGPAKDCSYIRLPPAYTPYVLRVSIDAGTPASRNGVFCTNFPLDGGAFQRDRFVRRQLPVDFSKPIQVDLPISHAGAFVFWVEYDSDSASGERIKGREGYFNIDPVLKVKGRQPILDSKFAPIPAEEDKILTQDTVNLPLDGLAMLTVVQKWMGPISTWREFFAEASERGYTMLHYPPLQQRGESNSPYSIRDQARYDSTMFDGKIEEDGGVSQAQQILKVAREEYGLLSLTDVVLNHTANDSPWLVDHPEAGFSPANSPHLTPALELDTAIIEFSSNLAKNGLPTALSSQADLDVVMKAFESVMDGLKFWQYYVLNVDTEGDAVKTAIEAGSATPWKGPDVAGKTVVELAAIIRDSGEVKGLGGLASRFGVHVDGKVAAGFIQAAFVELKDASSLSAAWVRVVEVLNVPLYEEWKEDTKVALESIKNRAKYTRLDADGPRMGEISAISPLMETYFTRLAPTPDSDPLLYSVANNGWIWAADPLANFALLPSKAYLRREVIVWSDCVKLRFGSSPDDNPWLWKYMTEYVTSLATTFDGFRLDNCHSTPLEVGVWMLDAARVVQPNLYVCAELFTGSEEMDLLFVKRLGVNSLVRESYNGFDPKELSRLLYRNGLGKPVGSMDDACLSSVEEIQSPTGKGPVRKALISPIYGTLPHALMYDLTHDNQSPADKRSAEDALSTAALVAFSHCAIASVKGFDDLYPKLLELVHEKRTYELTRLGEGSGIAKAKRVLNRLHWEMVTGGFIEGHVHQENDYIVLSRMNPTTRKGYVMVAHTAFSKGSKERGSINPIIFKRTKATFVYGATLEITSYDVKEDPSKLTGFPSKLVELPPVLTAQILDSEGPYTELVVPEYFPPGSIMVFETHIPDHDVELDQFCVAGAEEAFGSLNLIDLNVVLHRADGEERDATEGKYGVYEIPGYGRLTYCGLEGWMHPLRQIMRYNDLGHSLCGHLREGTWAFEYVSARLEYQTDVFPNLKVPAEWIRTRFDRVKETVPPAMRPKYFALIISEAYKVARREVVEQSADFISSGHNFAQDLALCAVQMHGQVKSASLNPGSYTPSLAAGLPHFAAGWARCWGRDVFISLRGLFLATGNFAGAKEHILAFASVLKHGLIPNLLDSLRMPRYNSRDSPWWMLQNIQDYVSMCPDGISILSETVKRRFPKDDTWVAWDDSRAYAYSSTLAEIIQEVLQRHADGIHFREYNAGPNLDMQMRPEGFNIDIEVDWETGLIFGGNEWNCGTWMDKMGESEMAGTKGLPGSPRDGSPIEIAGLLQSTLRWLDELSTEDAFPFKGVQVQKDGVSSLVTYGEWSQLLRNSFERCYYIPEDAALDAQFDVKTGLVNRRGIYKDVYRSGAGREWSDYQFRPNFAIAMTVAPELFDGKRALGALKLADKVLRAPLGMKTLDHIDLQYNPVYDNTVDSTDAATAKGRNYHNGPEWGWPLGYFLRAYLHFDTKFGGGKEDVQSTLHHLFGALLPARGHIQKDPWAGIPELTNKDGAYCADSCNTQAWSASTLLDFLEEVSKLGKSV